MTVHPATISSNPAYAERHFGTRFQLIALGTAATAIALLGFQTMARWGDVLDIAAGYGFGILTVVVIWLMTQFIWVRLQLKRHSSEIASADPMDWYKAYLANIRWGDIASALIALIATTSCFSVYKATAVGASGYGFDAVFIAWDRAIFGGNDPWVYSHAMLSSPYATKVIDILYHPAFLPMVLGYAVCAAAQARPALRYTYMVSYLVSFVIVGMMMANALHSAGPVYDGALFGDGTTFAPLIERLSAQNEAAGPFSSAFAQEYLLVLNEQGVAGLGGGISAMPSMHIILAFLWTFAGWHLNRVLGVVLTIYAAVIWMGSVHLGWHYFVDGLVGLAVLGAIWLTAGQIFGLYGSRQVMRATT